MRRPPDDQSCAALALGCRRAGGSGARRAPADDDVPIDTKIVRGILEGLGLKQRRRSRIDYQERPPLVIPPSRDLPPPEETDAALPTIRPGRRIPDVARARARSRARSRNRNVQAEVEKEQNPLRPDELDARREVRRGRAPRFGDTEVG